MQGPERTFDSLQPQTLGEFKKGKIDANLLARINAKPEVVSWIVKETNLPANSSDLRKVTEILENCVIDNDRTRLVVEYETRSFQGKQKSGGNSIGKVMSGLFGRSGSKDLSGK